VIQIRVSTQAGDVLNYMRKGERSLRIAAANALNATAKKIQVAERAHVRDVFRLRPRGGKFILRQATVIQTPWASARPGGLAVTVKVGEAARLLLKQFESGEAKQPQPGRSAIAIPRQGSPARPTFSENVPRRMFVESFRLQRQGKRTIGAKRTFVEPGRGIMQQQPGKAKPIVLYLFRHEARLDRRLQFVAIARRHVAAFYPLFEAEVARAVAFKFEHYGERAFTP